jgi:peptide/nickel transport system permease protein
VTRFLLGRLAALVTTLAVASVAIYGAMFLTSGDPATLLVGGGKPPSPAVMAAIHRQYHLDDPFLSRYWRWLTGALHGDFGTSLAYRDSVNHLISARIGDTLILVGYATVLILAAGIGLGMVAALRGGAVAILATAGAAGAMAVPTFVAGALLGYLFGVKLAWFTPTGDGGGGFGALFGSFTLPAVALALAWVGYVSQVTQASVGAELRSEHVATAEARGIPRAGLIRRHVLRNAAGPVIAVSGVAVAGLIATTSIVEKTFGISGIGGLLVDAAAKQDMATVQTVSLLMVAAFIILNTVIDLVTTLLDPRIRTRRPA